MASTDNEVPAPIIVKKIKKGGGGHHGGAWKVAYADFVTAMMAFFLLMWLLNVTTEEQKNAISNYFDPTHPKVSSAESGAGGILGGLAMSPDGAMATMKNPLVDVPVQTPQSGNTLGEQRDRPSAEAREGDDRFRPDGTVDDEPTVEEFDQNGLNILDEIQAAQQAELEAMREALEARETETFEGIKQKIYEEIEKSPELADLKDHLLIDITPEGLRIQIVDNEGRSMFPSGQAAMYGFMEQLLTRVTQIVTPQPNQISVRGHTDGVPYPDGAAYDNWNLSADRALASRSVMIAGGLPPTRVENVVGRADREHLLPDEPLSPRNRRISIVLLKQNYADEAAVRAAAEQAGLTGPDANAGATEAPETPLLPSGEDREDLPALDQTIEGPVPFIIGNGGRPAPTPAEEQAAPEAESQAQDGDVNDDTDIVDELRIMQQRNQEAATQNRQPRPALPERAPAGGDGSQRRYLQF